MKNITKFIILAAMAAVIAISCIDSDPHLRAAKQFIPEMSSLMPEYKIEEFTKVKTETLADQIRECLSRLKAESEADSTEIVSLKAQVQSADNNSLPELSKTLTKRLDKAKENYSKKYEKTCYLKSLLEEKDASYLETNVSSTYSFSYTGKGPGGRDISENMILRFNDKNEVVSWRDAFAEKENLVGKWYQIPGYE